MGKTILTMIISAGVFLLLICGCTVIPEREDPAVETGEEDYVMTFTAGSAAAQEEDDITRTTYTHDTSKGSYKWTGDEELSVFILDPSGNILHKNLKFTAVAGSCSSDGKTVSFEGTIPGGRPATGSTYYMVHPYSESCLFRIVGEGETAEHLIDVNIPTEQRYSAKGAVDVPLLARATESGGNLTATFTSMCAKIVIPIKITSTSPNWSSPLRSVRIRNNSSDSHIFNTHITGLGRVNIKNHTPTKMVISNNNGSRTASVVFPDAGYTIRNGTELEVVIMTKYFNSQSATGITIDLITADGYIASKVFKHKVAHAQYYNNRANILPEVTIDLSDFRTGYRFDSNTLENPQNPTQGDGSPENPWRITNANQLAGLNAFIGNRENHHVRLETDIEITAESWIPLNGGIFYYGTIFDGNGHIISGKMVNNTLTDGSFGLWKEANGNGAVKNLHISADIVDNKGVTDIGSFFGRIGMAQSFLLENCTYSGTIRSSPSLPAGSSVIGGLIGYISGANNGGASARIANCSMTGDIRWFHTSLCFGGILGIASKGDPAYSANQSITIENCTVAGTFDINEFDGIAPFIGGILGFSQFYGEKYKFTIRDNTISPNIFISSEEIFINPIAPVGLSDGVLENNNTSGMTVVLR